MKAYIKVVYSSEGMSPAQVEGIFNDHGFNSTKGQSAFEVEVADEAGFNEKLTGLHTSLKGTGVRYMMTSGRTFDVSPGMAPSCKERLEKWRDSGIDVDELSELLEVDVGRFRERSVEMTRVQFERIATEREKEIREKEAKEKAEGIKKRAVEMLASRDGHSFMELVKGTGMEEDELQQMLLDFVDKGRIRAEQRGRHVVYAAV